MALIDEYKQAIQDVLDGRAKPAPKPSELPWTEDKLASMWAAAAAELIAEENASGGGSSGGGVLIVHSTYDEDTGIETLDTTAKVIMTAMKSGLVMVVDADESYATVLLFVRALWSEEDGYVFIRAEMPADSGSVLRPALCSRFVAAGDNDYPVTDLT